MRRKRQILRKLDRFACGEALPDRRDLRDSGLGSAPDVVTNTRWRSVGDPLQFIANQGLLRCEPPPSSWLMIPVNLLGEFVVPQLQRFDSRRRRRNRRSRMTHPQKGSHRHSGNQTGKHYIAWSNHCFADWPDIR